MDGDRLRVVVDDEYTKALGLALFAFARLEWDAVWCIEKMSPGSIGSASERTAGGVAKELAKHVGALNLAVGHPLLSTVAEFESLVRVRNAICHGKPGTDVDGGQRLFRDGCPWTVERIAEAADAFSACQIKLNDILYSFFERPRT